MIIVYILAFIFAIGIIILIHEAGHFYCAKKAGILCHEFSIGMGPVLWQKKKGETMISIRAIPIGGYVAMADSSIEQIMVEEGQTVGLILEDENVKEIILDEKLEADTTGTVKHIELLGAHGEPLEITIEIDGVEKTYSILSDAFLVLSAKQKMQITPYERSFDSKKISHRFITISAGVVMNFVLAIVIYIIIAFVTGVPNNSNVIGSVSSDFPGASYLEVGDKITKINEHDITNWDDISDAMNDLAYSGQTTINLTYTRDDNELTATFEGYYALNTYGLSNYQIDEKYKGNYNSGVQIGNVSLKYGKSGSKTTTIKSGEPELTNGDYLLAISVCDGAYQDVNSWADVYNILGKGEEVRYINYKFFDQESKSIEFSTTPIYNYSYSLLEGQDVVPLKLSIGIGPQYHFSFFKCLGSAFKQFASSATIIFSTLKELIVPSTSVREVGLSSLSGVIGIFGMVKSTIDSGLLTYLSLIALLSVNIGIMNFLPIPALDGGRAVFLIYEAITHKKPNKKFETLLNNIVFILLIILFIYVAYNDILRIVK